MPTIQRNDLIGISATNLNLLAGTQFEFLPYDSNIAIGFSQSATGLLVSIYAGADLISADLVPVIKATSPINPDDFSVNFDAYEGTRLTITVRNTTAGALTILTTVIITPL